MFHRSLCFMLLGSVTLLNSFESRAAERIYTQFQPPRFKAGRLATKLMVDQFSSEQNFNSELEFDDLLGDRFQASNVFLGIEWDYSYSHNFHIGMLMGRAESLINQEERTKTQVKGFEFGGAYKLNLKPSWYKIVLDYRLFHNMDKNNYENSDVSIGDAVSWAMIGTWLGTDSLKYGNLWAFAGFKYPFSRLSANLVYQLKLEGKLFGLRAGGGFEGQLPVIDDRELESPIPRLLYIDRANAGSFHYLGINSEFIELGGWLGFEVAPYTNLKLGAAVPFAGANTSFGMRYFAQLEVSFSISPSGYSFPFIKVRRPKKNKGIDPFRRRSRLKNYKKSGEKEKSKDEY